MKANAKPLDSLDVAGCVCHVCVCIYIYIYLERLTACKFPCRCECSHLLSKRMFLHIKSMTHIFQGNAHFFNLMHILSLKTCKTIDLTIVSLKAATLSASSLQNPKAQTHNPKP